MMERYGIGKRILAALLVLTLLVSCVPGTARAAVVGDIISGDPGIAGELDAQDTISWPIRIYDYLLDGMLFGHSNARDLQVDAHTGGSYGGGQSMPMRGQIRGIDYTSVAGYYNYSDYSYTEKYAFTDWGSKSAYGVCYDSDATEVERSIVQPVEDVSPMYLHLEYTGDSATRSYGWISDFARDEAQYLSKEDIRYAVIVYRTNESYDTAGNNVRLYWSVSDADYDMDYSTYSGDIDISDVTDQWGWQSSGNYTGLLAAQEVNVPYSAGWSYVVVDMKSDLSGIDYGIASNWDLIGDERIAGVGMGLPLLANGEAMDISHIAYFGTTGEAERFGQKCVAFDNDPGEYLGYTIDMTHEVSGGTGSSTAAAPTVSVKGWDFTTANAGAWNDSVFATWADTFGLTTTQGSAGYQYVNVSNADSVMDDANIWDDASYSSIDDMRYVTVVYRTHGITAPAIGMWLADDIYGIKVGHGDQYRVDAAASENSWVAFTYDLYWLESRFGLTVSGMVDTFTQIGILFPGFTSASQSMDIAYIDYHTSSAAAQDFAASATGYLNGYTFTGDSVVTTLTRSSAPVGNEMWNMGNNQAFTMLYASSGGGWAEDNVAGGENLWSNGYYSYQVGYNYTYQQSSNSTVNEIREVARTMGYPVSDSIFMLNTYSSRPDYLYGVSYETDDSGYAIASTKYFDMSQLELGYTLYSAMTGSGLMTAGLLDSGLTAYQGVDGDLYTVPQYKDDTVSYIAALLRDTLTIPERDYWGYNYNYVKGTPNAQFCEDVDGDGKLDLNEDLDADGVLDVGEDLDGDGVLDADEDVDGDGMLDTAEDLDGDGTLDVEEDLNGNGILDEQDLASALRQILGITFPEDVETLQDQTSHGTVGAAFGSYAETSEKFTAGPNGENLLIGPFLKCAPNIETVYDAAWYLLHNLFVPGSYNQIREEYDTLVLSKATLSDGTGAYVFDSGFTTADAVSATVYDKENKTIYQTDAADKHQIYYMSEFSTMLCPFLPIDVSDCTGPYAVTGTPYFRDDGAESVSESGGTLADRNYGYVMAANGQFTYNSETDQKLEVSGDDDMYLFVNGELVMDVGGCHSITSAQVVIGDAVNAAYQVMAGLTGYEAGMSDEALEELLAAQGIVGDQAQTYRRNHRLCLIDGQSYPIDLYYMDRIGWGANLRLASTFQIQPMEEEEHVHSYVDGICSVCGAAEPVVTGKVIYFRNTDGWSTPYIYAWNSASDTVLMTWPGYPMELVSGTTDVYSFTLDAEATNVVFSDCGSSQTADQTIPTDGRNLYDDGVWSTYGETGTDIVDSGSCGDALEWVLYADGTLEIWGEGDMDMFTDPDPQPWAAYRDQITAVTIGEGVTSIGSYAFSGCQRMEEVMIPETVTAIGARAFEFCGSLMWITLPLGLTSIEAGTFCGCGSLRDIQIPSGVKSIGEEAFAYCWQMTQAELPEGLTTIGYGAFTECSGLTQLQLPESLTSIGNYAFYACTSLDTVRIPSSVTEIGISAFTACSGLTSVEIAEGVTTIGESAFAECGALTKICLPETLGIVKVGAFRSTGLQTVEYAGSLDQWVQIQIEVDNDPLTQAQINFGKEHVHSYDTVVEDATCTEDGTATYTCPVCGDSYTETIPATGHDYERVVTDATCTEVGYTTHTCTVCGDSYVDSEEAALGHGYASSVTEATCTQDGIVIFNCIRCDHSYSETIPATGHSYVDGVCGSCGAADPDAVTDPGLSLSYPTLSFEDEIIYNVYYSVSDMTSVVEMGLMLLPSMLADATMDDAIGTVPGYVTNGTVYLAKTEGIPAANMGDTVYFKVYAKLTDGTYAYSNAGGYNAKAYAGTVLSGDYTDAMKSLVVAMVNYGAEAQLFFGHNTDALVNSALTEEQKALVSSYDESMVDPVVSADSTKTGNFVRVNANFDELYPSVSFDGAFSINYYCTPAITVDSGMTLYYWDSETYDSITEFTVDNATGSMEMTATNGQYWGCVSGIAAKDMDKTYYVSCVFQSQGETITTGIIAYSLGKYCESKAAVEGDAQQAFAQATAVYGYYAKQYFASIA